MSLLTTSLRTSYVLNYTVAGDRLTISITVAKLRAMTPDSDAVSLKLFDLAFKGIEDVAFSFKRGTP